MEQQETNYIRLDAANASPKPENNIFDELGSELDFGAIQKASGQQESFSWLSFWYKSSYVIMVILVVASILGTIDVFLKSSNDNSVLALIPGCEFIATYGTDAPNSDCLTSSMLLEKEQKTLTALEDNIAKSMLVVLPKFLRLANVLTLPEVRFIQENTNNTRVNIVDMLTAFQKIKNDNSITYGSFIDCKVEQANEKGDLSVNCSAYGGRLLGSSKMDPTSRNVAATFIEKLSDTNSPFMVIETPKALDITQFMSTDPGKSLFNTQTTFTLKLKFTPNAQL